MPIVLGITAAAGIGGALSNREKKYTTTNNYSNTSTTNPNITPAQLQIFNALKDRIFGRLNQPTPLGGYEATGLSNINDVSNAAQTNLASRLAASGLSGSPMAANAETQLALKRAGAQVDFRNSLPLLARSMGREDEASAAGLVNLLPIGSTTTSSGTGEQVQTTPSNMWGGAFSGIGGMLGFLAGQGAIPGLQHSPGAAPPPPVQSSVGTIYPGGSAFPMPTPPTLSPGQMSATPPWFMSGALPPWMTTGTAPGLPGGFY